MVGRKGRLRNPVPARLERASQKFGSVDRKFRASPARSHALLNTRFNGSAFMHVRRGEYSGNKARRATYPNALRSVVPL